MCNQNEAAPAGGKIDSLNEFLLAEYNNIAAAQFNMVTTISNFFRHYLVIVSIPVTLVGVTIGLLGKVDLEKYELCYDLLPAIAFSLVALVGFSVFMYIANMRWDAILYARTVNGIRKHFFENTSASLRRLQSTISLPTNPRIPRYHEKEYFIFVVLAFSIINSTYGGMAALSWDFCIKDLNDFGEILADRGRVAALVCWISIVLHFAVYAVFASLRETSYLRSNKMGVDVDGVLNQHRTKFSEVLLENEGITIKPEDITVVPVHKNPSHVIDSSQEVSVFNTLRYWTEMPVLPGAAESLRKIKDMHNLRIHIFTKRDWPVKGEKQDQKTLKAIWTSKVLLRERDRGIFRWLFLWLELRLFGRSLMRHITLQWMRDNRFDFDKLTIEGKKTKERENRFGRSRTGTYAYFVEDEIPKATSLSHFCHAVFLIDQPYNQTHDTDLPRNVIRVKTWDEIVDYLSVQS